MDVKPAPQALDLEGDVKANVEQGTSRAVTEHLTEEQAAAESRMRTKMDWCLMPLISLIYLLAFIDRSNIGNAKLAGLEADLGMRGLDYNKALSVFYVSYILLELPLTALCKRLGPGRFLPAASLAFGACTVATAFVASMPALCGLRFLLGVAEAAMMPGIVYYLSRWYRRAELTFRLALFIVSAALAGAFGGLLASAILRLPRLGSLRGWRMIFAIEGAATCVVSIVALFVLPDSPETAPWLSGEEKDLAVARLIEERRLGGANGQQLVDEASWAKFKLGIVNPVVLPTSMLFLLNSITVHGVSLFLPSMVRSMFPDRGVEAQQLLTVPPYVLGAAACLAISYCSWRLDRRGLFLILCCPLSVVGYAVVLASSAPALRYGATFLPFVGIFAYGSLTNSHVAANVVSDTARSAAVATNSMLGSVGGLISTWTFVESDAPRYAVGNGVNLGAQAAMLVIAVALYFWIKRDNERRSRRLAEGDAYGPVEDMDWRNGEFLWRN